MTTDAPQPSSGWVPATVGATVLTSGTVAAMFNLDKLTAFLREFGLPATLTIFAAVLLAGGVYSICRFLAPLVTRWFNRQDELMLVMASELPTASKNITHIKDRQEHFGELIGDIHRAVACNNNTAARDT